MRIKGEKINVNYENIQEFFDTRGAKDNLKSKYSYVLFQDDHPDLAELRDKQEKEKIVSILPSLNQGGGQYVLDIGCGIGRWGEYLLQHNFHYVGIDGSANLIKIAEENLKIYKSKSLLVGLVQNFLNTLKENECNNSFDYVFINGVFMYINDSDYEKVLVDILKICSKNCIIYSKESMAVKERLTLDNIYSDGLKQNYTAIYRSINEYKESQSKVWSKDFVLMAEGELYDRLLQNRKETLDYYFIWKKDNK